ncbi:MAG: protein kinase domain-containing protein [Bacteroidota bacterium]
MPLDPGTKLGPYEILAPIGAGGMGEVYRARDPRLGRDVAVKVLPAAFARDKERLQRFEHEARAAGALNHPGITAIYDVGATDGIPYLVSELLEGQSLRTVVAGGRLAPARVAELGIQAADALAAAHAKGIVHRDLKPENLHVLPDGRLKVLDFGLAKLTAIDAPPRDETGPQLASLTLTGTILGTASYMAPEQVRDQPVDHRADLFALGAILYELASGNKAFAGDTPADRMTAILARDPDPLPPEVDAAIPELEAVIRRCLEKRASDRFDSARDLAFTLRSLVAAAERSALPARAGHPGIRPGAVPNVRFHPLTHREGLYARPRFASDGQTIVYAAACGRDPFDVFIKRLGSQEPRPLGLPGARLLAVSRTDEILVRLRTRDLGGFMEIGVLARMPLMGGTPRELSDDVYHAAFGPDGRKIAVVRVIGATSRLEYPIGTVLHETEGWFSNPLVLPDETVAFLEHPIRGSNAGHVAITSGGGIRRLTESFLSIGGLAPGPGGRELLFSGQEPDSCGGIFLVSLGGGGYRPTLRTPTAVTIEDVSANHDVLISSRIPRMRMESGRRGQTEARDLSWLDWSLARDLTPDGDTVLFDETGVGVTTAMTFLRGIDGSPAVQIADGVAIRFSPDGKAALTVKYDEPHTLEIVPTGIGESVRLDIAPVRLNSADWFPDGKSLCIAGYEPGRRMRLYRRDLTTRSLEPIGEEGSGVGGCMVSPDGRSVFTQGPRGHSIYPVSGGEPRVLHTLGTHHRGIGWTSDGAGVYAFERGRLPCRVLRLDTESGREETWMEIHPRRDTGVVGINNVVLSRDAEHYVASYVQSVADLYLVQGLL